MLAARRLASVARAAVPAHVALRPVAAVQMRWSGDALDERRSALENNFFNKEDERLIRGLVKKMKAQADHADKHAAKGQRSAEKSHLLEIVGKYNMSSKDIAELIEWKHENH